MSNGTQRLAAKVENNDLLVFNEAGESITQMLIKRGIIFQPPKAGPNKCDEARAGFPHPLKFSNGSAIILRRPPILTALFQKWKGIPMWKFAADLLLVDQNKRLFDRDRMSQLFHSHAQTARIGCFWLHRRSETGSRDPRHNDSSQ